MNTTRSIYIVYPPFISNNKKSKIHLFIRTRQTAVATTVTFQLSFKTLAPVGAIFFNSELAQLQRTKPCPPDALYYTLSSVLTLLMVCNRC